MADKRYSRKESSKRRKSEEVSKPLKQTCRYKNRDKYYGTRNKFESKTPPMPATSSLAQLIKQRDSLKNEINKINLEISHSLKDEKSDQLKESIHTNIKECYESENAQKRKTLSIKSPELNESIIDSEDEEIIIEQRRIKRRQLLDKINSEMLTCATEKEVGSKCITETNSLQFQINIPALQHNHSDISATQVGFAKDTTDDMFSEKGFDTKKKFEHNILDNSNVNLSENWDTTEGYYNITIGDVIDNKNYTIKGILGQGVFANVITAQENNSKADVAIKIMRNNELIYKTGLKELALIKEINEADPQNKYHCVKYITNFMHKGHLCIVLEPLFMDMRKVIKIYGKHGLNMKAVISYSRQLQLALRHLKKLDIVHADVKPDNILVNEKKNILKLCDFGSASKANENEATPYLVSRFYRAPEIILGIPYKHSIDVWSAACTIYEMATGKIMFIGSSNNKMLQCFMNLKGKFPSKLIRKGIFKDQHFNYNNNFLLHKKDKLTGREKNEELYSINVTRNILFELKKAHQKPSPGIDKKILQLKDLLEKMLTLDSSRRLSITDCLKHPFIQEKL